MPERPDYKAHPLWAEAIALAHQAYAVAEGLRERDPEAARLLRHAAVAVPAHVAGAISAEEAPQRAIDVSGARAALAELAARAQGVSTAQEASSELLRRARALDQSVALELGLTEDGLLF